MNCVCCFAWPAQSCLYYLAAVMVELCINNYLRIGLGGGKLCCQTRTLSSTIVKDIPDSSGPRSNCCPVLTPYLVHPSESLVCDACGSALVAEQTTMCLQRTGPEAPCKVKRPAVCVDALSVITFRRAGITTRIQTTLQPTSL